jgi:hypothetical protein
VHLCKPLDLFGAERTLLQTMDLTVIGSSSTQMTDVAGETVW